MRLIAIGAVAGFFGALFGVGGGVLIVPLLILLERFDERKATATSLAAIGVTALAASITYGLHGEVKPGAAALVGLPAAVGAFVGASLQQRLRTRTISLLFSLLLALVAVRLLVA